MDHQDHFDANRKNWDERVAIHRRDTTGFYGVAKVLAGQDKLNAIEAAEIGDIRGLRGAHLQCHFGLDTISLGYRGARMTGLDFSPVAIMEANRLVELTGSDASFIEGNVYDARALLKGEFDFVYVTWGAINWLPDIARWASVAGSLLKPGGFLYLAESLPSTLCLEEKDGALAPHYPWRTPRGDPMTTDGEVSYNGDPTPLINRRNYEWMHPMSDIINGIVAGGMDIAWLHEHDTLTWPLFPMMTEGPDGLYRLPREHPALPLAFSLRAVKR